MKVQMVVMANASEHRGRSLIGIMLVDGSPAVNADGPHWLRPIMYRERPFVPVALVVDLLPRDIVEFEILAGEQLDDAEGWVCIDFFSLRIVGRLGMEDVEQRRSLSIPNADCSLLGDSGNWQLPCIVLACKCKVVCEYINHDVPTGNVQLHFGCDGVEFQLPLTDAQFLEWFAVDPDLLDRQPSVQLVLAPTIVRSVKHRKLRVASVLV